MRQPFQLSLTVQDEFDQRQQLGWGYDDHDDYSDDYDPSSFDYWPSLFMIPSCTSLEKKQNPNTDQVPSTEEQL